MDHRRIILHVGTHKTGTSSFQASLGANADTLRARGVGAMSVVKTGNWGKQVTSYNLAGLASLFLRRQVMTIPRLRSRGKGPGQRAGAARRNKLADGLAADPARDVILSAEGFCFLRSAEDAGRVQDFIARSGRTPLFVLVLRNDADWRASWNNQLGRNGQFYRAQKALTEDQLPNGEWYFDRDALQAFWSELGDLRVIDYDAELAAQGSVLPALYRQIGVDPDDLNLDFERNRRRRFPWAVAIQRSLHDAWYKR